MEVRTGHVGNYKEIVQAARDQVRKAKTQTGLNLAKDINSNMNFLGYFSDKKKSTEDTEPPHLQK